ncbi:hypothetical protein Bca4012_036509 [Brassica carinata]
MFPKWDGDVDDPAADNIIKVMFDDPGWKWTMDCWQITGTQKPLKIEASPVKNEASPVTNEASRAKKESVVKEESSRPPEAPAEGSQAPSTTVGGMAKEQFQMALKDISDAMMDGFGTCLREIKLVGDRMGAVEKKMGALEKMPETTSTNPAKPMHEPGCLNTHFFISKLQSESVNGAKAGQNEVKEQSLTSSKELAIVKTAEDLPSCEPIVLILEKQVLTAEFLLQEEARRQTKKEAYKVNLREKSERDRKLAPTQQTPFKGNSTAKQIIPNKKVGKGYDPFAPYDKKKSEELTEWLKTDPCPSRFYQILRTSLEWLSDHQMDSFINLLRQRYQDHPDWFMSDRMCFLDHLFSRQWRASYPDFKSDLEDVNGLGRRLPGGAWNYHAGEIPSFCQSMKVWGIIKHIRPEQLDEVMEPFITMVPYLLVECAISDELKAQYTLETYTYERKLVGVPQCRAGDCGVFALKYIEFHALGMEFSKAFSSRNGKAIREKMVVDIYQELPMCHDLENQDNDENLGTYD